MFKVNLRNTLISALGFGIGTVIAVLFSSLVLGNDLLERLLEQFEAGRLMLGISLVILVAGLGGAIGGAIGGLTLSYVNQAAKRWGYVWRTALSFGFSYAVILTPLTLVLSLVAFYQKAESSPIMLMIPLGLTGIIFGVVCGLMLGLLTVGRNTWRVVLLSGIGFGLGGAGLGYDLWWYFFGTPGVKDARWLPFVGFFVFGAIGGGALGYIYSWLIHRIPRPFLISRLMARFKRAKIYGQIAGVFVLILVVLALRGLWLISPFSATVAPLASVLESNTIGTHWGSPVGLAEQASQPAVFAGDVGHVAIAWSDEADVYYTIQVTGENGWLEPVNVSNSAPNASTHPQLVSDSEGKVHLVWTEAVDRAEVSHIFYSRCADSTCTAPENLSELTDLDCISPPATQNEAPTIAIDEADTLLVAWRNGSRDLLYRTWLATASPLETATGCIPTNNQDDDTIQQPRLASGATGSFSLVFDRLDSRQNGTIYLTEYTNDSWTSTPERIGEGSFPEILTEPSSQIHLAWCDPDHQTTYWNSTGQTDKIAFPGCVGRPNLAQGQRGYPRLIWYANEVENVGGAVNTHALIYESVNTDEGWTEPTIVAQTSGPTQPALDAGSDGTLHLTWHGGSDGGEHLYYTTHTEYDCSEAELSDLGQVVYDTVRQEKYRPATDLIPFCQNQVDRLIYAPNPEPAYTDETPKPNGVFDHFAELAKSAEYEVNFSTMWYDAAVSQDSPGSVLAEAVADLYQQLKQDPSRYPRGLTVRLLLDNPPTFALFPTYNNQVRTLLEDLRAAGVPEMRNPELGWNLEVANYAGAWPHSHTKMMVVDGKTVIAAGYNLQYAHFPKDHASGRGKDKFDLGLQVTGPVAQTALRAFDDLWQASTRVYCSNLDPDSKFFWMFSCSTESATAEHVPEVLHYHVPASNSHAFSLHRTQEFREADEVFYEAITSASSSIDIIQVNFSLELICDLNVLLEVCNIANRIEPLDALLQAVETNQTNVRVLVKGTPIESIENNIAIKALLEELEARGLRENIEIRYFDAEQVHPKAVLIDDEILIIGSHNFHYSAWGEQALTEYSLATDDPVALQEFKEYFDYQWERGIPVEAETEQQRR